MTQTSWQTQTEGRTVTIARALPVRFDVSASAQFPMLARRRLAHQIRQDMWRALQNVRGFSPVVRVEPLENGLHVTAGGRIGVPKSAHLTARIEALLNDPGLRARWIKCAAKRAG